MLNAQRHLEELTPLIEDINDELSDIRSIRLELEPESTSVTAWIYQYEPHVDRCYTITNPQLLYLANLKNLTFYTKTPYRVDASLISKSAVRRLIDICYNRLRSYHIEVKRMKDDKTII